MGRPYFQIAVQNGLGERNAASPYHESLRSFYALPTNDWSIVFKPQLWGFLIAAPENAYSFYHFIRIASLIWGFTFLFRQVGIDLHWAVLGALLIFFSRFVQVWWTSIGPTFAFAAWPVIAALAPSPCWRRFILTFYASAVWLFSLLYIPFIIGGAFAFGGLLVALRRDALKLAVVLPAAGGVVAALMAGCLVLHRFDSHHAKHSISRRASFAWRQCTLAPGSISYPSIHCRYPIRTDNSRHERM